MKNSSTNLNWTALVELVLAVIITQWEALVAVRDITAHVLGRLSAAQPEAEATAAWQVSPVGRRGAPCGADDDV
jgi:hypothetical protein